MFVWLHRVPRFRYFFPGVSDDPLFRLGLVDPSLDCLKIVCCVFSAYHAVKGRVRAGEIQVAPFPNNDNVCSNIKLCWDTWAQTLAVEATEFALNHRAFTLPKFIAFLVNGGQYQDNSRIRTSRSSTGAGRISNSTFTHDATQT